MKNILYNTCMIDPWLKVAKILHEQNQWKPVYWIEYTYEFSDYAVKKEFPDIVYHPHLDAWKGVFPDEVEKKYIDYTPDVDFLISNTMYELEAFTMMNRLDFDRHSFNLMEREFHYYNLIKHWLCVIDLYKPDIVISGNNPHRVYDFALYIVCKQKNIPFIMFQYSNVPGRIFATTDISSLNGKFKNDCENILNNESVSYDSLAEDIRINYENTKCDDENGQPWYMAKNIEDGKKGANWLVLAKHYFKRGTSEGGKKISRASSTIYKNKKYPLKDTKFPLPQYIWMRKKAFDYNKSMIKIYDSLIDQPKEEDNFVLFPLHYQPEETTSPCGGFFVNQWLCIETILANTPSDWFVYVKEHPNQFLSHNQGQTSRISELYYNLKKNPRIKLMPLSMDSKALIRGSKAVATITGTVGWEALVRQKPVVVFGTIWYDECKGVLKVSDSQSAKQIYNHIIDYNYSENSIIAYLQSLTMNSIKAYHYQGYKELTDVDEDTSANNIVSEINKVIGEIDE